MRDARPADEVEERLVSWARRREAVRAVLLTSTRAVPGAEVDACADDDAVLVVRDVRSFAADRGWLGDFGEVLVAYWDPIYPNPVFSIEQCGNVTQYTNGLKIDFTLWPVALFQQIVAAPMLPAELDAGYRVLLDKDHLTATMRANVHRLCAGTTIPRDLSDPHQRLLERCTLRRQVSLAR